MQVEVFKRVNRKNKDVKYAYSSLIGNIHLKCKERDIKTILITSCNQKEGKTLMATDLAVFMAMMGKKTLLVDMDLRKPFSEKRLEQSSVYGIYEYITQFADLKDILSKTNIDNLFYLCSGRVNGNPMSILCSEKLNSFIVKSRDEYDCVIFDTPALDDVGDAIILAAKVDATILVAEVGFTRIVDIIKAQEQLNRVNANIIGVVLNKTGKKSRKRKDVTIIHESKAKSTVDVMA